MKTVYGLFIVKHFEFNLGKLLRILYQIILLQYANDGTFSMIIRITLNNSNFLIISTMYNFSREYYLRISETSLIIFKYHDIIVK